MNKPFSLSLPLVTASLVTASLALASAQQSARAHAIESSLERLSGLSNTMQLESRFGNGEPASNASVRLVPPGGGTAIEIGRTDASGQLRFQLPRAAGGDWELQVDRGPGHRDYLELPAGSHAQVSQAHQNWFLGGLPIQGLLAGPQALALAGLTVLAGWGGWRWARRRQR